MKLACEIALMGGAFASQPLAFAHLLDAAHAQGTSLDLDYIEVLQAPYHTRLAQWFDAPTRELIPAAHTLVAFLPGSGGPLAPTEHLAPLGAFPGVITRAPLPHK